MRIDVLTLFPDMFTGVLSSSMLRIAAQKGLMEFYVHNIRDYSASKHKNTDDYPYGGGAGMVMMVQPIADCLSAVVQGRRARKICLSPRGKPLTQSLAKDLAGGTDLALLCGHYEGIDERAVKLMDDEVSIGDYVLTGGELPAMVLIDCLSRFIPGVLGSDDSARDESFGAGILEYPQYTRPADFFGDKVPETLLNGNHAAIARWRREQALLKTKAARPDLLLKAKLCEKDERFLAADGLDECE